MKTTLKIFGAALLLTSIMVGIRAYNAQADIYGTNLKEWWNLDNNQVSGTSTFDLSGNGMTATLTNSPTTGVAGVRGQAFYFNGSNLFLPDASRVGQTFTYSLWFKRAADGQCYPQLIGTDAYAGISGSGGAAIFFNQNLNTLRFEILFDATTRQSISMGVGSAGDLTGNFNWHHVVGVSDDTGKVLYLYLDNHLLGTTTKTVTTTWSSNHQYVARNLNSGTTSCGAGQFFNGYIDDVRIYNVALTASQVSTLYYSGINNNMVI